MKACGSDNVVISIQGLKSACAYYYHYGISQWEILKNLTLRDLVCGTMVKRKRDYKISSGYETDMLKMAKHIIGRTSWDNARTWAINPLANYYSCNETLRREFYTGDVWTYERCKKHSIFMSQAATPLKGFHQLLKAMPLILRYYPDAVIRVAGHNVVAVDSPRDFLKLSGYGKYIRRMINRYGLSDHIQFVGNLDAEQMKQEYLDSNVFVSPSSIENSPNSVGEAQILGVPCVASYVGGVADMMSGNEELMYRFEEVELLAKKICDVFASGDRQNDMRKAALIRHDPACNSERLLIIYKTVTGKCSQSRE
jgi:glycosyltransferase involved in cell wall biosynthesis